MVESATLEMLDDIDEDYTRLVNDDSQPVQ